jgi:PAS domain S-box-containing protein
VAQQLKRDIMEVTNIRDEHFESKIECEEMYRAFLKHAELSTVIFCEKTKKPLLFNRAAYEMLGYTEEEFRKLTIDDIDREGPSGGKEGHMERIREKGSYLFKTRHWKKNGEVCHVLISSVAVDINGVSYHQNIGMDITETVFLEQKLSKSRAKLEMKVEERTSKLKQTAEQLGKMNIALNVLLDKRENDRRDLEKNVLNNIEELVVPYLQLVKQGRIGEREQHYLEIIESSLNDITSPFSRKLADKLLNLSPAEIKVSNLIKQGHPTKKISAVLSLSSKTVEGHRNKIRQKLGLTSKKVALQTYLLSI